MAVKPDLVSFARRLLMLRRNFDPVVLAERYDRNQRIRATGADVMIFGTPTSPAACPAPNTCGRGSVHSRRRCDRERATPGWWTVAGRGVLQHAVVGVIRLHLSASGTAGSPGTCCACWTSSRVSG
jgi:hypothetical protein